MKTDFSRSQHRSDAVAVSNTGLRPISIETPPELRARGFKAFKLQAEATGDATGGTVTQAWNLNPGGTPAKFFAICSVRVANNDLANAQNVQVYSNAGHFERSLGTLSMPIVVSGDLPVSTSFAYDEILKNDEAVYLGECIKDQIGTVNVRHEVNTDTKLYKTLVVGLEASRPFVVPELGAF